MNRTEVLEQLEPIMNTQLREVDHNPRTRVMVAPEQVSLRPGGGKRILEVTPGGVMSLVKFSGLPENVAKNIRPETFGMVATELLAHKRRYSVVTKDGAITSFVRRGEYRNINPERALQAIESGVRGADFHRVLILDNLVAHIEVVGEERQPVSRGDLIQAGAMVQFSPIGTIDPLVQAYALRLTCTNGNTHNEVLREFHLSGGGDGDDIWQWFRRSVREAYQAINPIIQRYRGMMDELITPEQRAQVLTAMLREAKISGGAADAVRAMAIENPPENRYQMMNLITYASSHLLERPDQVRRAQNTAADYAHEHANHLECPMCHRHN
ncbi:hypothetical protein KKF82_04950 [Patescibacteria group bacterium]|nr:hypothetical protein [Patescibacteria group bacterium]